MLNYYEILEVNENSSTDEIKKSFKKLAFKYHPDINPEDEDAKQRMVELIEAYDVLSNPIARNWYNLRSGSNSILAQFEEAYQNYYKARAKRYEEIRQELEAERDQIKEAYQTTNRYISVKLKIVIYGLLLVISLEGVIYNIGSLNREEKDPFLFLFFLGILAFSFIKIANVLYIESLYNKHFKPEGKIREESVPFIMTSILIAGFILFFLQPNLMHNYSRSKSWQELNVQYFVLSPNVYYNYEYLGKQHVKITPYINIAFKEKVDSLRIHFSTLYPNEAEIIGVWSEGIKYELTVDN